jgi:hypothetical protein
VFLRTLSFAVLLVFCFQCAKSPSVTQGSDKLGVVNFPDWFLSKKTTDRGLSVIIATGRYEVRKGLQSFPGELFFQATDNDAEPSVNFFAVTLDGQFTARSVSADEWTRAEPLSSTRFESYGEAKTNAEGAQYRGKIFAKTGRSWESAAALPSPGGKWIVVFSHTSEKDNPSYGILGGGGRGKGEMFIDVYDTSSGKKILSGHAPHGGGDKPGRYFNDAFWAGDRYLIVPMDSQITSSGRSTGDSCFLGILPAP